MDQVTDSLLQVCLCHVPPGNTVAWSGWAPPADPALDEIFSHAEKNFSSWYWGLGTVQTNILQPQGISKAEPAPLKDLLQEQLGTFPILRSGKERALT